MEFSVRSPCRHRGVGRWASSPRWSSPGFGGALWLRGRTGGSSATNLVASAWVGRAGARMAPVAPASAAAKNQRRGRRIAAAAWPRMSAGAGRGSRAHPAGERLRSTAPPARQRPACVGPPPGTPAIAARASSARPARGTPTASRRQMQAPPVSSAPCAQAAEPAPFPDGDGARTGNELNCLRGDGVIVTCLAISLCS
jgi:hypothetical protein